MRKALFLLAPAALLVACQQSAERASGNQAANAVDGNAAAPAGESSATAAIALPTEPVSGEAARKIQHDRHENYEKMGKAMKLVSRELKGDAPDLAKVREGAATMAAFAPQIASWFPPGSGPDAGKTEAKAEIWQKPDDFTAKIQSFVKASQAFKAAAAGTDLAAIRAAHGNLGKSCQACHDLYREEHT